MSAADRPRRFVPPSAILTGFDAHLVARVLRYADGIGLLTKWLAPGPRCRLLEVLEDIELAAAAWHEDAERVANGNAETPAAEIPSSSESMTIDEVAGVLGVSPRRVRQLAPALGEKRAGRWVLDRPAVLAEAEQRGNP